MSEGDRYIHDNRDENLGKPLFEMCCYHIWAFSCFRGGQNACQDDLCTFSSFWQMKKLGPKKVLHSARLTGGGLKLFGQYPNRNNTFQKGASLRMARTKLLNIGLLSPLTNKKKLFVIRTQLVVALKLIR